MRGEKDSDLPGICQDQGSPPLARGKAGKHPPTLHFHRITPACAGKSKRFTGHRDHVGDHPRLRGEKFGSESKADRTWGSPPLARGKAEESCDFMLATGITPACAGKRNRSKVPFHQSQDHPRLRGEKSDLFRIDEFEGGSPPLARGKATAPTARTAGPRITPACAGKRNPIRFSFCIPKDHPRLRGEK